MKRKTRTAIRTHPDTVLNPTIQQRLTRAIIAFIICTGLFLLLTGRDASAVTVRQGTSSSDAVVVEISSYESKTVVADPNNARRLAAEAGYKMLVLVGIPLPVIGETALSRAGTTLLAKYSTDIARCAKFHDTSFTLEYNIDVERIRKTWLMIGSGGQTKPGSPASSALSDIIHQLTIATPRLSCPEI